jgi:hypothetical protein
MYTRRVHIYIDYHVNRYVPCMCLCFYTQMTLMWLKHIMTCCLPQADVICIFQTNKNPRRSLFALCIEIDTKRRCLSTAVKISIHQIILSVVV